MNKFLVIRLGALGDVVHGIPAAAALRRRYPQAQIDWLVEPQYVPLLDLVECIDARIPFDTRDLAGGGGRTRAWSVLAGLRRERYDVVIDLQGLIKSAVLARAVGGKRTIGFPGRHLREPAARFFYSEAPDPGGAPHVIDKNLALLAAVGVEDRSIRFPVLIPRTSGVAAAVERAGYSQYALINAGAAWPNKRWPPGRFGAVAAAMRAEFGLVSLVLWGPGEQGLAGAVAESSGGAAIVAPPTTIADVVGVARHARIMVSGDTGPLHLAGAVDTPIVALFGPTFPERNGPWSSRDVVVSRASRCSCHYERHCRRDVPCIEDIGVDEVMDAVRQCLMAHD